MQDIGVYEVLENKVMLRKKPKLTWRMHFHEHIEILYMVAGTATAVVNQKEYTLTDGDFLIVFPFQSHSLYNAEDVDSYFVQFPQRLVPEFNSIFDQTVPLCPLIKNDTQETQFAYHIFEMMIHDYKKIFYIYEEIDTILFKSYLHILLDKLLKSVSLQNIDLSNQHSIKSILDYCSKNYMRPLHLQDVADNLHLSRKYVSNIFSSKLHIHFLEYIGTLRVYAACAMLRDSGRSVTDIAFSAGFSSIRTFHRHFEKVIGLSPNEYRKNAYHDMGVLL